MRQETELKTALFMEPFKAYKKKKINERVSDCDADLV